MIGGWQTTGPTGPKTAARRLTPSTTTTSLRPWAAAIDARQAGDECVEGLDKVTAQMAGGEHRPEQQEMCRAVAEAIATGTHLVVQAGTGTGKSLAYLVPAALSGKKVVVARATMWRTPKRR